MQAKALIKAIIPCAVFLRTFLNAIKQNSPDQSDNYFPYHEDTRRKISSTFSSTSSKGDFENCQMV